MLEMRGIVNENFRAHMKFEKLLVIILNYFVVYVFHPRTYISAGKKKMFFFGGGGIRGPSRETL